jgi:hypothetical protein
MVTGGKASTFTDCRCVADCQPGVPIGHMSVVPINVADRVDFFYGPQVPVGHDPVCLTANTRRFETDGPAVDPSVLRHGRRQIHQNGD